jgi:hypothetical protein
MLVLKAFVNYDQIDEIWVQNVSTLDDGFCEYTIRKPKGDWSTIVHKRSDGWRKLFIKVLEVVEGGVDHG